MEKDIAWSAPGREGTLEISAEIDREPVPGDRRPAYMRMNANGKAYTLDKVYGYVHESLCLLAVDVTGEWGSIGPGERSRCDRRSGDSLARWVRARAVWRIGRLLARHGRSFDSLDGFASASGPGSFTGCARRPQAVMGLAEATGRKVAAVSNLQALASFGTHALRAAVIDARRGEVFGGVYDAQLRPVCGEVVTKLPLWLESLPDGDLEIITQGFEVTSSSADHGSAACIGGSRGPHRLWPLSAG